ncbi:hypothetical protein Dda_0712 [Drechslerella dactyloides]|uniref:Uncharacterized protein n=1 Tax=Drechslerella dactyloides TaxID=74499 RepID=A0AAD6NNM4_DREDA|nr:hypothetical protein Dda_0712 [Drechslerella dactyloides]
MDPISALYLIAAACAASAGTTFVISYRAATAASKIAAAVTHVGDALGLIGAAIAILTIFLFSVAKLSREADAYGMEHISTWIYGYDKRACVRGEYA